MSKNYQSVLGEIKASSFFARLFRWTDIQKNIDYIISEINNDNINNQLEIMENFTNTMNRLKADMEIDLERKKEIELRASSVHEEKVEKECDSICKSIGITCYHKSGYPYSGLSPDNAIEINGICFIFDAKSPDNNYELEAFEKSIKSAATHAKKYITENTSRIIYFVVPGHTLHIFNNYRLQENGYEIRIISVDSMRTEIEHIISLENHQTKILDDKIIKIIANTNYTLKSVVLNEKDYKNKILNTLKEVEELPEEILDKIKAVERRTDGAKNKLIAVKTVEKDVESIKRIEKDVELYDFIPSMEETQND